MLLYAAIGACIAAVPLALMLIYQSFSNAALNQQIDSYKKLEEHSLYLSVWRLNKDIAEGEKVERADLEKKKIWVSEKDNIDILANIHQIAGRKAKKALKKGTVLEKKLLYGKKQEQAWK